MRKMMIQVVAVCLLFVAVGAISHKPKIEAAVQPPDIEVSGGALEGITVSPVAMTPTFSTAIMDYAVYCTSLSNALTFVLSSEPSGLLEVEASGVSDSAPVNSVTVAVNATANELIHIRHRLDSDGTVSDYYVRCLPPDFPKLAVTKNASVSDGYYVTGNSIVVPGTKAYAMILDSNGTPVWYQRSLGNGAINVTPLGNTVSWMSGAGPGFGTDPYGEYQRVNVGSGGTLSSIKSNVPYLDFHELQELSNGNRILMSTPVLPNVDLTALGLGASSSIYDCIVEEQTSSGQLIWKWSASDHVDVADSTHPFLVPLYGRPAYDIFHCNSVDIDPVSNDMLMSARHTDSVYRVSRTTGEVIWKLGGNSPAGASYPRLSLVGDAVNSLGAQHDARFTSTNTVSLFDNQSWSAGPARGVEYQIDSNANTATLIWEVQSPDNLKSIAMGSFRRYQSGASNLVNWGLKADTLFTEYNNAGNILLDVRFTDGSSSYRTVKVPVSQFDLDEMRISAAVTPTTVSPKVTAISPATGSVSGGTSVMITGTGFRNSTSVMFGSTPAQNFVVYSDTQIVATAPAGVDVVDVTVISAGGQSVVTNVTAGRFSFEAGTQGWFSHVNGTVSSNASSAHEGTKSLSIAPVSPAFVAAMSPRIPALADVNYVARIWAKSSGVNQRMRAFVVFYDVNGNVLNFSQGPILSVGASWERLGVQGTSPAGTALTAYGVDNLDGTESVLIDDGIIGGNNKFQYGVKPDLPETSFETGINGWMSNFNSEVTHTGVTAASGMFSAKVSPITTGFTSAASPASVARPSRGYTIKQSVRTDSGNQQLRAFAVFLNSSMNVIEVQQGPIVDVSQTWIPLGLSVNSPNGTAYVVTGVDSLNAAVPFYIDDTSIPSSSKKFAASPETSFELGDAGWSSNVNANVATTSFAYRGSYALKISPTNPGFSSAAGLNTPVAAHHKVTSQLWVNASGTAQNVRPFIVFSDVSGNVLEITQGAVVSASSSWQKVVISARAPANTASVRMGLDLLEGTGSVNIDDAVIKFK